MDNYYIFVYSWIIIGAISFPFILKYGAPYGRHTSNNWGPLVDNKTAWIIMELPALILCPFIVFTSENPENFDTFLDNVYNKDHFLFLVILFVRVMLILLIMR